MTSSHCFKALCLYPLTVSLCTNTSAVVHPFPPDTRLAFHTFCRAGVVISSFSSFIPWLCTLLLYVSTLDLLRQGTYLATSIASTCSSCRWHCSRCKGLFVNRANIYRPNVFLVRTAGLQKRYKSKHYFFAAFPHTYTDCWFLGSTVEHLPPRCTPSGNTRPLALCRPRHSVNVL